MPKLVDHQTRRSELGRVAAKLIATGGMEAATIREVALASGYSKGVVEHYFIDKDELINAALEWTNLGYEHRVQQATSELTGLAALRQRIAATLPMGKKIREEWKVRLIFWSIAAIQVDLRKQQKLRFEKAVAVFQSDIDAAVKSGDLPATTSSNDQARRLVNAITGLSIAALHAPTLYNKTMLTDEIDDLLTKLM